MRKAISFILLLFSMSALTLNETSCFCFNRRKDNSELVDISDRSFDDVTLNDVQTGDLLYNEVRTQIGSWADPEVDESDISSDSSKIIIKIKDNEEVEVDDNDQQIIKKETYTVSITILSGDSYFEQQFKTDYSINITSGREKVDISNKGFNSVDLNNVGTGDLLWTEVKTQIASWAIPSVDESDISDSWIEIKNGTDNISDNSSSLITEGTYTVEITIDTSNTYFIEQATTSYEMNVTSQTEKVNISNKHFNNVYISEVNTGQLLWLEVEEQIGGWADPEISAAAVSNDEIIDEIKDNNGSNIYGTNDAIEPGSYTVTITVQEGDDYFQKQDQTSYYISVYYNSWFRR